MINSSEIKNCALCNSSEFIKIMSLGKTPLANEFLTEQNLSQDTFPLNLQQCINCKNVQLDCEVNKDRLYRNYLYVTGTSAVNVEHFKNYANTVMKRFFPDIQNKSSPSHNDLLIDIGSNDGTFLKYISSKIARVGVDPAKNIAEEATKNGIETISDFFNEHTANKISIALAKSLDATHKHEVTAKVITANHVFAHTKDLETIVKGVRTLLSDDGIFIFENSYLLDMVNKGIFDVIYHEHIHHHHLTPLIPFFKKFGMRIYDVELFPEQHGGSFRAYVCKNNSSTNSIKEFIERPIVNKLLEDEKLMQANLIEKFRSKTIGLRRQLWDRLPNDPNVKIGIYGYPAKATTLIRYCGFINDPNPMFNGMHIAQYLNWDPRIQFVVDDAKLKQGLYIPGGPFKVQHPDVIVDEQPDYLLILAWNFADSIIEKCRDMEYKGKFIVPLPELRIVE